jgi:hypothetical protein
MGVNFSIEIGISFDAEQPDRRIWHPLLAAAARPASAHIAMFCVL